MKRKSIYGWKSNAYRVPCPTEQISTVKKLNIGGGTKNQCPQIPTTAITGAGTVTDPRRFPLKRTPNIFSVSQRTWIISLRTLECLWFKTASLMFPGCVFFFFSFWLSVNSLSSPVNGYSEAWGRWPIANVGVHSYIITKASSSSSEFL